MNDTPIVNSGSSLSLDGTTGYAEISAQENSIDLSSSNFTLSAWIVLDGEDSNTNAATIMSTGTGSTNNGLYFMVEGGELELSFYGNNFLETNDLGFEGDNTWHHVAATFEADSNTAKLYVDGTLEATDTFNSAFSGQGTNFTLGTTAWNYVDKFEGFIDEAAVWKSALSASQIATLANDSKNPLEIDSANLSAYWEIESNSGNSNIITDLSSNSNHLTNNATLVSNGTSLSLTTLEDTDVNTQLYVNDVDGDELTYSITSDASNGTTSLSGNIVTYSPDANYNGSDSFTYVANDGATDSATGTVNITVTAVNDAPTTDDIATTIDENRVASRSTGITLQGSDVDGDNLTYSIVSAPSNGTASISGATLTYEANQDYNGTETITYKANDGTVDSNTSTITITITPVNDTPVVTTSSNEKSLYFEGIDSFTVFNDNALQSVEDFAISMWVKFDVDDSWEGLLSKGYLDGVQNGFTIRREEDNNKIRVSRSSGNEFENILESTTSITASSGWTNVIVQREGNDWELFINGVSEDTETVGDGVSQTFNNTEDFVFAKGNGTQEYLEGYLDDFVMFDDYSSSEISELYNNGGWRSTSEISASSDILFLYLDEDATDSSGNNRSSTNNGADFVDIVPSSATNTDITYWVQPHLQLMESRHYIGGMDIADSGKITGSVDYALNDELQTTDVFLIKRKES